MKFNALNKKLREARLKEPVGLSAVAVDAAAMDAFSNPAARLGHGTPSLSEGTEYELVRWTQNYWLMITLFRNHWISRRIVEKPAQDMCKAWAKLTTAQLNPKEIASFDRVIRRTYTPKKVKQAITWARLFGGAGALMVIDGHDGMLDKPLNLDDVNPGSYKGLIVFDRWSGITPSDEMSDDINSPADFNLPKYYEVRGETGDSFKIHSSRILRFTGPEVPQPENQACQHWGISELEVAYEDIRKRDNASWSILALMFRAQLVGMRNPELWSMLSGIGASGQAMQKFQQQLQAQNELMSNQSTVLVGKDGEMFTNTYSFGGISEVYSQFQMDIAGAAKMPVSILFGRTVTGIGQSNDADIRIYEQDIAQKQDDELRPQLDKLYPVVCMSEFGEIPDDLDVSFPSIRVLTEEQKGDIAGKNVEAILSVFSAGVTSQQLTLQELQTQSESTGLFTNITEELIEAADDKPVDPLEMAQEMTDIGGDDEPPAPGKKPKKKGGTAKDWLKGLFGKDASPMNYYTVQGLPIVVETQQGQIREGKNFTVTMPADYGYIEGTLGADGDEMDCYIGPDIHQPFVYIVSQNKMEDPSSFDEHKCMIGYETEGAALKDYFLGHHKAERVYRSIVRMDMPTFKDWLTVANTQSDPMTKVIEEVNA